MEAALQAVSRSFGLRRVPPPLFPPAQPEHPAQALLSSLRQSLQEHREAAQTWINQSWLDRPSWFNRTWFDKKLFDKAWLDKIWPGKSESKRSRLVRPRFTAVPYAPLKATGRQIAGSTWGVARAAFARIGQIELYSTDRAAIRRNDWNATLVRLLAYIAGVAGISIIAGEMLSAPQVAAAVDPTPMRREWLVVDRPYPAFHLGLPGFAEEGQYIIRRHAEGGGRKDIMTWGEAGTTLRYVMVEVYRPGSELDAFGDAASEIAARAADLGPTSAARASFPIQSKFGPVATVDFAVGRFGAGHCVGFARAFSEPRLQISGMSCNMDAIVDREAIACALDRLTLMSAGSAPDVAKLFAHAELKRTFCGQRDPLMYATPRRPGDTGKLPAMSLRGRTHTR